MPSLEGASSLLVSSAGTGEWMNKRKKVAWRKHRVKAKKAEEKRKANRGRVA